MQRLLFSFALVGVVPWGCGGGEASSTGQVSPPGSEGGAAGAGKGGSGGISGSSGQQGGKAGSSAGSGGSAAGASGSGAGGVGGGAGKGGSGGSAGSTAGSGGSAGGAGQGGSAGAGGAAGAQGGSSGQGGSAGSGAGAGGSGGFESDISCPFLKETGAPIRVEIGPTKTPVNPAMVHLGGGKVALTYGAIQNEFPAPGPPVLPSADLRMAMIDGLGPWPAAPIQPLLGSWEGKGVSYALESPVAGASGFGVLTTQALGGEAVGPVALLRFDLEGSVTESSQVFSGAWPSRFFARGPSGSLVGADGGAQGHRLLHAASVEPGKAPVPVLGDTGCATEPVMADALWVDGDPPLKEGFLLATSSSRPAFSCLNDDGIDGPPTRVQLVQMGPAGSNPSALFDFDLKKPVRFVRLLPGSFGPWLVTSASDGPERPLRMIPVMGASVVNLTEGAVLPTQPAVDRLQASRMVVAYVEEGGQVSHLMLRSYSQPLGMTTREINANFPRQPAVIGLAPDTVLVSWIDAHAPAEELWVARYQCVKAE